MTYIIYHTGTSLLMTVLNTGKQGKAVLIVEPGTCISIVPLNMKINQSVVVCSREIIINPGKYYVELLPTPPVSSTVNMDLAWLPTALVIVLLLVLAIYIAYVYRR